MAYLQLAVDDNSLDDAELWDFIDSTVARRSSYKAHQSRHLSPTRKPLLITHHTLKPPVVTELPPSPQVSNDAVELRRAPKCQKRQAQYRVETAETPPAESKQRPWLQPQKVIRHEEPKLENGRSERFEGMTETHDSLQRLRQPARFPLNEIGSHGPIVSSSHELIERSRGRSMWPEGNENIRLSGNCSVDKEWMSSVPSASMFKHIQNAAMGILEQGDYVLMQGKPFIKKSGWRKIAFFFNISFEIKDKTIQFDQNSNVQRAEFIVRANMQSGRFSDGWGSCDRGEKRFSKPNHDIPSTAETRAKTRACQDLLGIGEYKVGTGGR